MKRKVLAFSLPAGLLIEFAYLIVKHFFGGIPDAAAYPMMVVSIVLMLTGVGYNGYCLGKHKNPYDFK